VKIFDSTQTFKNVCVLKFDLILIIGSNNVLTEGARKVYRGRRVGQGWYRLCRLYECMFLIKIAEEGITLVHDVTWFTCT
jgi:hypothetical protein